MTQLRCTTQHKALTNSQCQLLLWILQVLLVQHPSQCWTHAMLYFVSHPASNIGLTSQVPQALFWEDECSQVPSSPPCCAEQGPWKAKLSRNTLCSSLWGFNISSIWQIILIFPLKKNLIGSGVFSPQTFGTRKPQTIIKTHWLII